MSTGAYSRLETRFRRMALVGEAAGVLHWDWAAVMPDGGAKARGDQLAELKALTHGMLTAPEAADDLAAAEAESESLDDWQRANLREMRRRWVRADAVPENLVVAVSQACSTCEPLWRKARASGEYEAVRPALQEVLDRVRESGQLIAEATGVTLYDALLDDYEPGARSADIDAVFDDLAGFLPDFLDRALAAQGGRPEPQLPAGPFPIDRQKALGETFMAALGFDFEHGRLDISAHPFSCGIPDDVRITTRYDEADFTSSLMGVLHETGHAMYTRGLPADWQRQPVGDSLGMSIHESQSLLVEMQVCRSRGFLEYAAPVMAEAFQASGNAWETENLYRLYTRVRPDFIRVDADEVTYPAHVILRYRLEKALLAGDLDLSDLPAAWNDGLEDLLGIRPPSDREGCLQDLHWYDGAWGYFPTYTLGAMTAAQLFDAAKRADADIEPGIAKGDFQPLMAWLVENVHAQGCRLSAPQLLTEVTGRPLEPAVFKKHLESRYLN